MKKGILYFVFAVSLLCVVGWFYWRVKIANTVLQQARNAIERSDYPTARVFSEKLLKIRPDHPEGILILAESTYKDETLSPEKRQEIAFELLSRIPDASKYASRARLHEASILLFDNLMPVKAEDALRRALDGEGEKLEIYRSLFQLYCCTSRETLAEPIFREMIG